MGVTRAARRAGSFALTATLALVNASRLEAQIADWPAVPESRATNLSEVVRGFRHDLSGAVWNPLTRTLWVCRNGPGDDSRLWVLEEDSSGEWVVGQRGDARGEWRQLGDCEGVTFANFEEPVVYLIVEGEERIHELDVSEYGRRRLRQVYDTSPYLPLDGADGAEGITFVPDEELSSAGFVGADGTPRSSRYGLGGLMFVGHQNGGGIYVFDLDRSTGSVDFVGEYRVPAGEEGTGFVSKVVGLEFDRTRACLLAWHGLKGRNTLSLQGLTSESVPDQTFRRFTASRLFRGPTERRYEGLALQAGDGNGAGSGSATLFLTVDDGGAHALFRYGEFDALCAARGQRRETGADTEQDSDPGRESEGAHERISPSAHQSGARDSSTARSVTGSQARKASKRAPTTARPMRTQARSIRKIDKAKLTTTRP